MSLCFEERKKAACCVSGCSLIALLAGCIMLFYAVNFRNKEIWDGIEYEGIEFVRDTASQFLITFAVLALILACLGVSTIWIKHRLCNMCLSLCLFPTWSVIFIFSCFLMVMSGFSKDGIDVICSAQTEFQQGIDEAKTEAMQNEEMTDEQQQILEGLDFLTRDTVDSYMCSTYCPCRQTDKFVQWVGLTEEQVVAQRRPVEHDWYFGALYYKVGSTEPYTISLGEAPIVNQKFSSFKECANYAATNPEAFTDATVQEDLYYFSNTQGENPFMEVVEFLETSYSCSGLCAPDLFYTTLSIDNGLPQIGCGEPVGEEFGDALGGIGAAGVIAGIMLFLSFLSSYCLWKKYDDE